MTLPTSCVLFRLVPDNYEDLCGKLISTLELYLTGNDSSERKTWGQSLKRLTTLSSSPSADELAAKKQSALERLVELELNTPTNVDFFATYLRAFIERSETVDNTQLVTQLTNIQKALSNASKEALESVEEMLDEENTETTTSATHGQFKPSELDWLGADLVEALAKLQANIKKHNKRS